MEKTNFPEEMALHVVIIYCYCNIAVASSLSLSTPASHMATIVFLQLDSLAYGLFIVHMYMRKLAPLSVSSNSI